MVASPKHRCAIPDYEEDSYSIFHVDTPYKVDKCSYTFNDTKYDCDTWVFDKTYYRSTLTEEVC